MTRYSTLRAGALIWAVLTVPARAEDYVVHWVAVEHDLTPVPQVAPQGYVARFAVNGDRFTTDEGGQIAEASVGQPAQFTTRLGTPHTIVYTRRGTAIVRSDTFPGFSLAMTIVPDRRGGCHASVVYQKAAGQALFESRRYDGSGPSTASSVTARDVRCTSSTPQS